MYKNTAQNQGQPTSEPGQGQPGDSSGKSGNDEVTDVDFEEVK